MKICGKRHYHIGMLYVIRQFVRQITQAKLACDMEEDWWSDPLSHPQLQTMSQRQLGDLPFDPKAIRRVR